MSGSLREWGGVNSGKWRLRASAGSDDQGKHLIVSGNVVGTRRQAETALAKLVADVTREQTKTHAGSVRELLDEWIDSIEADRARYTVREHRRSIEKTIGPALGSSRLDRLRAKHLDNCYIRSDARVAEAYLGRTHSRHAGDGDGGSHEAGSDGVVEPTLSEAPSRVE
jgi:hypothetical protein